MTDEPDINGVELEELIAKAAHDRRVLNTLLYCKWMTQLLKRVAIWARRRYNVDGEEVRDYVFDRIHAQTQPSPEEDPRKPWLRNPNRSSWKSCLARWVYVVAKRRSLRMLDHFGVETRHAVPPKSAHIPTPAEEFERKEQHRLMEKFHEKAAQAFHSSTEECQLIVSLWKHGMTLEQLADELGSTIETVRRKLKKAQKAILEQVRQGIAEEFGEAKAAESDISLALQVMEKNREDFDDLLLTRGPAAPAAPAEPAADSGSGAETSRPQCPHTQRRHSLRRRDHRGVKRRIARRF